MIRLFIVDRARSLCDAMTDILSEEPDISVVGTAITCRAALSQLSDCDMVLVAADLPGDGALQVIRAAARQNPPARVVLMDWSGSPDAFHEYASSGAAAYTREDDSIEELLEKMRTVHDMRHVAASGARQVLPPVLEH